MKVLIIGGNGYIGSNVAITLSHLGHEVLVIDNYKYGSDILTSRGVKFFHSHIGNFSIMSNELTIEINKFEPEVLMNFAALKSVPESIENPISYYENNLGVTEYIVSLLGRKNNIKTVIHSSTAAIYGEGISTENDVIPIHKMSPYAKSKLMSEEILNDACKQLGKICINLRYFNPIGIGIGKLDKTSSLFSRIRDWSRGEHEMECYGTVCRRDFIDIHDLVSAHIHCIKAEKSGTYNVGTGDSLSVYELLDYISKRYDLKLTLKPPRKGDIIISQSDVSLIKSELGWNSVIQLNEHYLKDYVFQCLNY